MMQTFEAVIDENGKVRLLEEINLPYPRRVLITILEDYPHKNAEKWLDNQEFLRAINDSLTAVDDEDEKEFLQLVKSKQARILD